MRPSTVICGSYHREPAALSRQFRELEACGVRILSPLSLTFDTTQPVVRSLSEQAFTALELEKYHLRAIYEATFVWLYAPDGYVGLSGAFELGYAVALSKPVFGYAAPVDETLRAYVSTVISVFEALELTALTAQSSP